MKAKSAQENVKSVLHKINEGEIGPKIRKMAFTRFVKAKSGSGIRKK